MRRSQGRERSARYKDGCCGGAASLLKVSTTCTRRQYNMELGGRHPDHPISTPQCLVRTASDPATRKRCAGCSDGPSNPFSVHRCCLGSRVVSVLDSDAEGPGFKSQSRRCRASLRQTVHTHCASVHQAAKLVAALLRVPGVTAGLAEINGSLSSGL